MVESGRILVVANQKGGVGKTTTVINLGAYLGALGHRVLLVDCDPQANTTRSLTTLAELQSTLYDVLIREFPLLAAIVPTSAENLYLLGASTDLAAAEIELAQARNPTGALRSALTGATREYAYVLLDCPPSLGMLTINALVAAAEVIVPVQCEYLALEGLSSLMDTIARVRSGLNPKLRVFGLLMTMYDRRTSLSDQVTQEVRRHYPDLTFETVIPRNVRLSEAPSFAQPIRDYDPLSQGARAYASLALEVVGRG